MNQYSGLIEELKIAIQEKENDKIKMEAVTNKDLKQYNMSIQCINLYESRIDYCENKLPIDIKKEEHEIFCQKLLSIGKGIGLIASINIFWIIGILIASEVYIIEFINTIKNLLLVNQFVIPFITIIQTIVYFKETKESREYIKDRKEITPQDIEELKNELLSLKEKTKELESNCKNSREEVQNICTDIKVLKNKLAFVSEQYQSILQQKYDKLLDEDFENQHVQDNIEKMNVKTFEKK